LGYTKRMSLKSFRTWPFHALDSEKELEEIKIRGGMSEKLIRKIWGKSHELEGRSTGGIDILSYSYSGKRENLSRTLKTPERN